MNKYTYLKYDTHLEVVFCKSRH